MAYGTPTDPVAGTVITVAYAGANFLDPIRALRAFTGGADPPGTGYVVTSDSVSATSWKTMLAAVLAALGYTPANKAGDTFSGNVILNNAIQLLGKNTGGTSRNLVTLFSDNVIYVGDAAQFLVLRSASVISDGAGNAVAVNSGVLQTGLNADKLDGFDGSVYAARANHTGTQAPATISPQGSGSTLDADLLRGVNGLARANHTGTQAPATISPQGSGSTLDADNLDGLSWFTPVHINASAGTNFVPATYGTIAGLTHTTTRAGTFMVVMGFRWDFTGSISALTPDQFTARVRRTGSGTVDSQALRPTLHPGTGYGFIQAGVLITAAGGDVLAVQAQDTVGAGANSQIQGSTAWMDVYWMGS